MSYSAAVDLKKKFDEIGWDGSWIVPTEHWESAVSADEMAAACVAAFERLPPKGKPPANVASWTVLAGVLQYDAKTGTRAPGHPAPRASFG